MAASPPLMPEITVQYTFYPPAWLANAGSVYRFTKGDGAVPWCGLVAAPPGILNDNQMPWAGTCDGRDAASDVSPCLSVYRVHVRYGTIVQSSGSS